MVTDMMDPKSDTLAARWMRFIVMPPAIQPAVDMLQGATTIASMEEEPLETFAAKSSAGATSKCLEFR
jgi:hypothetical protein